FSWKAPPFSRPAKRPPCRQAAERASFSLVSPEWGDRTLAAARDRIGPGLGVKDGGARMQYAADVALVGEDPDRGGRRAGGRPFDRPEDKERGTAEEQADEQSDGGAHGSPGVHGWTARPGFGLPGRWVDEVAGATGGCAAAGGPPSF